MFQGWQRTDVISALALVVSGLAFLVAIAAARYSAIQAGVARRREREDVAAREPVVEGRFLKEVWPGWWSLRITIRNRLDVSICCETLRVVRPGSARMLPYHDVVTVSGIGIVTYPDLPPAEGRRQLELDETIPRSGASITVPFATVGGVVEQDRAQVELLVFMPSTRSSSSRPSLTMSLKVRRSNESVPYAETIVVTKMPAVRTSSET